MPSQSGGKPRPPARGSFPQCSQPCLADVVIGAMPATSSAVVCHRRTAPGELADAVHADIGMDDAGVVTVRYGNDVADR
jgi:hypothetical protein